MRKSALISISMLLTMLSLAAKGETPVPIYGKLSVQGTQIVDTSGNSRTLRGVSFGWHNWHTRFYNAETVKWLKDDWHCTVVRAAMGIEPWDGYLANPDSSKATIEKVIKGAIDEGIYVIVDWHSHGLHTNEAKRFFGEMASKYADCPNIIWELYNEPINQSWDNLKQHFSAIIDTIRTHCTDNIILVGNPHWNQDIHIVADSPLNGYDNIMYTMHFYAGTHRQELRDRCNYALSKGIPIFISECGSSEASGNGNIDIEQWNTWIDWCELNDISWVQWHIADKDESSAMLKPGAQSLGNWAESALSKSGVLTRDKLLELNK